MARRWAQGAVFAPETVVFTATSGAGSHGDAGSPGEGG
jgi:hypothetical protein